MRVSPRSPPAAAKNADSRFLSVLTAMQRDTEGPGSVLGCKLNELVVTAASDIFREQQVLVGDRA